MRETSLRIKPLCGALAQEIIRCSISSCVEKVLRIVLYIFFIVQSLCGKLYKEKKIIFLNGSPCGADSVSISLCVRVRVKCACEVQNVSKRVCAQTLVCVGMNLNVWTCLCACVSRCLDVCTHRMPTVRLEGEGTPAFCHFNPPYPVIHRSLRSARQAV